MRRVATGAGDTEAKFRPWRGRSRVRPREAGAPLAGLPSLRPLPMSLERPTTGMREHGGWGQGRRWVVGPAVETKVGAGEPPSVGGCSWRDAGEPVIMEKWRGAEATAQEVAKDERKKNTLDEPGFEPGTCSMQNCRATTVPSAQRESRRKLIYRSNPTARPRRSFTRRHSAKACPRQVAAGPWDRGMPRGVARHPYVKTLRTYDFPRKMALMTPAMTLTMPMPKRKPTMPPTSAPRESHV